MLTPEPCRFLAGLDADGTVRPATTTVDPAHVCVALVDPVPQSGRQQELVCLTSAQVNCPRYLRGLLLANAPAPPARRRERLSPAVIGAGLLLLAAIAASFGFLAVRGGFELAVATALPQVGARASSSTSPTSAFGSSASAAASSGGESSPAASASAAATPSPSLEPTATPSPTPRPTPSTTPTSNRFAVLTKCSGTPDCWVYTIRSGDNLHSIANWFGVSYRRMLAMNPSLKIPIHAGEKLRIPTPTR